MNENKITLLLKTSLFEWKPFLPIKSTLETFISQAKCTDDGEKILTEFQSELAKETINSQLFKKYPPCPTSTVTYIKRYLLVFEASGIEGNSLFYDFVSQSHGSEHTNEYYKSYFDEEGEHLVSLVEKRELICEGTTGLRTWQAGKFLYKWILDNYEWLPQKKEYTILELGSGIGFTGISLLKNKMFSPTRMLLTDHHDSVLYTLLQNVRANFDIRETDSEIVSLESEYKHDTKVNFPIQFKVDTERTKRHLIIDKLDWEYFTLNKMNDTRFACDIVIGADIVFDTSVIPYLVDVIVKCITELGTE